MIRKLIVLRAIPGAGKSTYAKKLRNEHWNYDTDIVIICSADDYFVRPDGLYDWNRNLLGRAHRWCQSKAKKWMSYDYDEEVESSIVIIDNTNIKKKDYKIYLDMAEEYNYEVEEVVIGEFDEESIKKYAERNTHGVPIETIRAMAEKFER